MLYSELARRVEDGLRLDVVGLEDGDGRELGELLDDGVFEFAEPRVRGGGYLEEAAALRLDVLAQPVDLRVILDDVALVRGDDLGPLRKALAVAAQLRASP